jgi:hypothetical protein
MKVKIDCEGCERKIKKALDGMKGTYNLLPHVLNLFLFSASYHDPAFRRIKLPFSTLKKKTKKRSHTLHHPSRSFLLRVESDSSLLCTCFSFHGKKANISTLQKKQNLPSTSFGRSGNTFAD